MGATGDRSAIVSASLPQLVQYSGQGFNQLHLPPPPPLHSTPSHSPTPHPNHFSNPARAWVGAVSLCLSALILSSVLFPMTYLFLTVLLRRLYPAHPPAPPSFIDSCGSIIDSSDPLTALTWHSDTVFISCLSASTQPGVFDPCTDCQ